MDVAVAVAPDAAAAFALRVCMVHVDVSSSGLGLLAESDQHITETNRTIQIVCESKNLVQMVQLMLSLALTQRLTALRLARSENSVYLTKIKR